MSRPAWGLLDSARGAGSWPVFGMPVATWVVLGAGLVGFARIRLSSPAREPAGPETAATDHSVL
jgi:hypothetical protein